MVRSGSRLVVTAGLTTYVPIPVAVGAEAFTTAEVTDKLDKYGSGSVFSMLAGVAGLCNDASFAGDEKVGPERTVNGDATGASNPQLHS